MSKFYSALFVRSTCFGPNRSIIRSVLYRLYSQTLVCGNTHTTRHVQPLQTLQWLDVSNSLQIELVQNAPDDGPMRSETCRANKKCWIKLTHSDHIVYLVGLHIYMVVFILKYYFHMHMVLHFGFHDQNFLCICCLPRVCHKPRTWFDHCNIPWDRGQNYEASHWIVLRPSCGNHVGFEFSTGSCRLQFCIWLLKIFLQLHIRIDMVFLKICAQMDWKRPWLTLE